MPTRRILGLSTISLLSVVLAPAAGASPPPSHICLVGDSGISIDGKPTKSRAINIYYLEPGKSQWLAFTAYPEPTAKTINDRIPRTGNGQYAAHGVAVDATGEQPVLTGVGGQSISCRPAEFFTAPEDKYFDGLGAGLGVSMGSVIRAAPDAGAGKIGNFAVGRHITIDSDTEQKYQGYTWLKVLLGREKYGYVWGGTVCSPLFAMPGTAECPTSYGGRIPVQINASSGSTGADGGTQQSDKTGTPGQSTLGTRVREKADTGAPIVASIPVGAPLRVVGETGSFYDTFQWVKISYSGGQTGYAWGGSICTSDKQIVGVHFPCQ